MSLKDIFKQQSKGMESLATTGTIGMHMVSGPLVGFAIGYGLDAWLLRRTARSRGYRRARCLLLLSRLPVGAAAADCAARYAASRNRYVRFQSLMVRLAADPSTALRLMAEYPEPFSACEVGEIMAGLLRKMSREEEQKRAEALADRPERVTVKKKTVVPDSIARACAAETAAVSRETGGRAPTAQLRTGTTSPEAPEGEGTKTGGHDRNDG